MSVFQDLSRLSTAEDFFAYLGVPFDPRVLNVARLHILRRMGERLAGDGPGAGAGGPSPTPQDDEATRSRYRAHLQAAYDDFLARSPLQERVFKVLKDSVKERPTKKAAPFVPLSALERK